MRKKEIIQIAKAFRDAFETVGRSYGYPFSIFPTECCTWASIFIGNFLIEEYGLCPQRVYSALHPSPPASKHEWTLLDNIIIDITADQFEDSSDSVIVKKESTWHGKLEGSEVCDYSKVSKYDMPHHSHKISDIYKSIKSKVLKSLKACD